MCIGGFEVDTFFPGINVEAFFSDEAGKRDSQFLGQLDGKAGRGTNCRQDWDARDGRFLNQLKADSSADEQDRIGHGRLSQQETIADQFIERVVPTDILTQRQQMSGAVKNGGRMETSGPIKHGLGGA